MTFWTNNHIFVELRQDKQQAQLPCHLEGFTVDAQKGERSPLNSTNDLKHYCFFVIDRIINEKKKGGFHNNLL